MGSRNLDKLQSLTDSLVFGCKFRPNNTGAILDYFGPGATAARTGVGTFVVTLADKWTNWESAHVDLHNGAADREAIITAIDLSARTITIVTRAVTTGTAADIAAATNLFVSLDIKLTKSSKNP